MADEQPLGRRVPTDWRHVERYRYAAMIPRTVDRVERTLSLPRYRTRYDQGREGACFPAGTLVRLADGSWTAIEEVRLLDAVLTAEGNVGVVRQVMVRRHEAGLVHVRLRGHAGIRLTAEHPVLTRRGYVPAGQLAVGDRVALTRAARPDPISILHPAAYVRSTDARRTTNGTRNYVAKVGPAVAVEVAAIPDSLPITAAFGRLCGLYLAEGHTTENEVVWTFAGHERDTLATDAARLAVETLGVEPRTQVRLNGSVNVIVYGKRWRLLFERLFYTGSGDKRVPPELSAAAADVRRSLLEGWLAGDGHRRRTAVEGVTISPDLALGMYAIANDLGLYPTVSATAPSLNRHARFRRERWSVTIPEGDGHRPPMDEQATWRPVQSVTHEPWQGFVYNLSVSGDESYVAEGIGVHNCVGFASSWMMSIQNRRYYNPVWLWNEAKAADEWPDTNPGDNQGTSVRAAMDVLRHQGHVRVYRGRERPISLDEGIAENRWATSVDEVRTCLAAGVALTLGVNWYRNFDAPVLKSGRWWIGEGNLGTIRGGHAVCVYRASDRLQAVGIVNNWGMRYPLVLLPYATLERLLWEDGEATMITDRP